MHVVVFEQMFPKNAKNCSVYLARIVLYNNSAGASFTSSVHYRKKDYIKITLFSFGITRQIGEKDRECRRGKQIAMSTVKTQKTKVKKLYFMPHNCLAEKIVILPLCLNN